MNRFSVIIFTLIVNTLPTAQATVLKRCEADLLKTIQAQEFKVPTSVMDVAGWRAYLEHANSQLPHPYSLILLQNRDLQTPEDVLTLLNDLDQPSIADPFVAQIRAHILPDDQTIRDLLELGAPEVLAQPRYRPLRQFLSEFDLTLSPRLKIGSDLWQDPKLLPRMPELFAKLIPLASTMQAPWRLPLNNLITRVLRRDYDLLREQVRARELEAEYSHHAFVRWLGDSGNPFVMFKIADWITKPNARLIDIGSGAGEPLLILGALFPKMKFSGYELVPEKVQVGNRMAQDLRLNNVEFHAQDLSAPSFQTPPADYYYFYNPTNRSVLMKVIADILRSTEKQKETCFIFRGLNPPSEIVSSGLNCSREDFGELHLLRCKTPRRWFGR